MSDYYLIDDEGRTSRFSCYVNDRFDARLHSVWAECQRKRKWVAHDDIGDVNVSTIFLGIDHRAGPGPPAMFATKICGGPNDGHNELHPTVDEARAGHKAACEMVRNGSKGD